MADTWEPINNGRQQSSFRRFIITLPPHGIYTLNNPFNCFRCYNAAHDFGVAWSSNSDKTDFGQGMMVKFDDVIPYAQIFNDTEAPLTIDIGVGIGIFEDSRLSVCGDIKSKDAPYNSFSAATVTIADGSAEIGVANKTIIQNTSSNVMYIGSTDGLQLQPQGTFEYALDVPLTIYGTDGDTLAVGSFN